MATDLFFKFEGDVDERLYRIQRNCGWNKGQTKRCTTHFMKVRTGERKVSREDESEEGVCDLF